MRPLIWFEQWRGPSAFLQEARAGVRACFCAGEDVPHYLSEAYVAGAFAQIWRDARGPGKVRLHRGVFPDAQFRSEGVCLNLEITMALPKEKKMFKEWRESKQGQIILAASGEQRQASAREAIPRVVRRKASKGYAEPPSLLVYSDDARSLTDRELARLTKPWKDKFPAIYILSGMDVVQTWPALRVLRGKEPI
jgi:hypothetical protein